MQFKDFITESFSKEYAYRVKIAANCGQEHLDMLEQCLQKYNVVSVAPWKRTPIQENPVEFARAKGIKCVSEVCSTDVVLKYPTNPRILEVWLGINMHIDHNHVLVYDVKEPRLAYAEQSAERASNDLDRDVSADDALLAEDEYADEAVDHDTYYGEGHTTKFLKELERIKAEKGSDYFRYYPTKDEIMGDNLKPLYDTIMNTPNMGSGNEATKEVDHISQSLGH